MARKQDWRPRSCADVWVLVYDHRHGTDVSVFRTEESALIAGAGIALEDAQENEVDEFEELKDLFRRGEYSEVLILWGDGNDEGGITVQKYEVLD